MKILVTSAVDFYPAPSQGGGVFYMSKSLLPLIALIITEISVIATLVPLYLRWFGVVP